MNCILQSSSRKTLTTHDVCVVSRLPISTALRRLEALEARGFILRQRDANDRRRSLVMLTERARELLTRYASSCRSVVTT